jgi:hypothetical protein
MPEDRKNDYEFSQKYYLTTQTELVVPAGYKVSYLPAAFKKATPAFSFEGTYENNGKEVVYKKTIVVDKPILRKNEFQQWNAFLAEINKFYNDQVVLVKHDGTEPKPEAGTKPPVKTAAAKPAAKKA